MARCGPTDRLVDVGGLRMHYRDWGGSGQPILLLHGLASTCHIWDLVAPLLSESFAVVAPDLRGHGESGKPDDGYDFETVCSDVQGFMQALGLDSPVIVGHSWGASVALEHAIAYPGAARGIALVDGGTMELSRSPGLTLERVKEVLAPPDFTGTTVDEFILMMRSRPLSPEMNERFTAMALTCFEVKEDRTFRARLRRQNHMQVLDAFWDHRPSELYPVVSCPVLLLPARQPGAPTPTSAILWPDKKEAVSLAERLLPTSETVWLEDSIHDVPIQRPELVAEVIRQRLPLTPTARVGGPSPSVHRRRAAP